MFAIETFDLLLLAGIYWLALIVFATFWGDWASRAGCRGCLIPPAAVLVSVLVVWLFGWWALVAVVLVIWVGWLVVASRRPWPPE